MRESPRQRRLRTDRRALENLRAESSIVDFTANGNESYIVRFYGRGFWRPDGGSDILIRERHEVLINLGASYPRMMPDLLWKTPVFHPNISASGVVCLGGYGTYWVPSLNLDELCLMLWDMLRYQNYDVESPYNREAALWAKNQTTFRFPVDARPIRDKVASGAVAADRAVSIGGSNVNKSTGQTGSQTSSPPKTVAGGQPTGSATVNGDSGMVFIGEDDVVDAMLIDDDKGGEDPDIMFID